MKKIHNVEHVTFADDTLILQVDGREYLFRLAEISPKLWNASEIERSHYRIMASGYGIHWPLIDEDLSIDGLLGIKHTPPSRLQKKPRPLRVVQESHLSAAMKI